MHLTITLTCKCVFQHVNLFSKKDLRLRYRDVSANPSTFFTASKATSIIFSSGFLVVKY